MRKISEKEKSQLILVEKSVNLPGKLVYQEDLPSILWGCAPRIVKGSKWFNSLHQKPLYGENICDSCMSVEKHLDRHELYGLYLFNEDYIIKFEGLMFLCKKCHSLVHKQHSFSCLEKYDNLDLAPMSNVMRSRTWLTARYLLIEDELYSFSELRRGYSNVDKR